MVLSLVINKKGLSGEVFVLDKSEIKENFIKKLNMLLKRIGEKERFSYLHKKLSEKTTISQAALRSWFRTSDESKNNATMPGLPMLSLLSDIFSVSIDELIGNDYQSKSEKKSLFTIKRSPQSHDEEQLVQWAYHLNSHYQEDIVHMPLMSISEKYICNEILFGTLLSIDGTAFPRICKDMEKTLKKRYKLLDTRVYHIPHIVNKETYFYKISNLFFSAAVSSHYFKPHLLSDNTGRVGLANGYTVSTMTRLIERNPAYKSMEFFPILYIDGALCPTSSAAVVSDLVLRLHDFGARIPIGVSSREQCMKYLETADAVFLGLGSEKTSYLIDQLKQYDSFTEEELTKYFVGDILFNLTTATGITLNEIYYGTRDRDLEKLYSVEQRQELRQLTKRIIESHTFEILFPNLHREENPNNWRFEIDAAEEHSNNPGLKTVAMARSKEKYAITKALFNRKNISGTIPCNVLLTDRELAELLCNN